MTDLASRAIRQYLDAVHTEALRGNVELMLAAEHEATLADDQEAMRHDPLFVKNDPRAAQKPCSPYARCAHCHHVHQSHQPNCFWMNPPCRCPSFVDPYAVEAPRV